MTLVTRDTARPSRDVDLSSYPTLNAYAELVAEPVRTIVGRDREKSQILSALSRPEVSNVLLLAPAGSGKALVNGTMIAVNDERGYVAIEDLVAGVDEVFDEQGLPTLVEGVYPQGEAQVYRVHFDDGTWMDCNGEHLWNIRRGDEAAESAAAVREFLGNADKDKELDDQIIAHAKAVSEAYVTRTTAQVAADPDQRWFIPGAGALDRSDTAHVASAPATGLGDLDDHLRQARHGSVYDRVGVLGLLDQRDGWLVATDDQRRELIETLIYSSGVRIESTVGEDGALLLRPETAYRMELEVVGVEVLDEVAEMTCIKVATPTALFQAGFNHVVTHNTVLVQSVMMADVERVYVEVDLARMVSDLANPDEMAARISYLFKEAVDFAEQEDREIVLFIDEFHQIVQLSAAAVEAIKPVLANSGSWGLKVIAATTLDEFQKYVAPNQALRERLQAINLTPADQKTTIQILKEMAVRYGVDDQFYDDHIFNQIYELTERYIPRSVQPRKSILVLDGMIGWHRATGRQMSSELLADVLKESINVNVAFRVDGTRIKEELDKKVFSQDLASRVLSARLQTVVADLHDKKRPAASFLFSGSTGVGKTEMTKQLARLLFGDDRGRLIRFDMSEFALAETMGLFRSELTKQVSNMGHSIILLDEVEKAHKVINRLLLQVLDDGVLTDDNNRPVSFLNSYIIMTTNAGAEIFKTIGDYAADDDGTGEKMTDFLKNIRRSIQETADFPAELLGRIDAIVPFQPLSLATQNKIIESKLRDLRNEVMAKHGVVLRIDKNVLTYLTEDKADPDTGAGGARNAVRLITTEVTAKVAEFINTYPTEQVIQVGIEGEMKAGNKSMRISKARVAVGVPAV